MARSTISQHPAPATIRRRAALTGKAQLLSLVKDSISVHYFYFIQSMNQGWETIPSESNRWETSLAPLLLELKMVATFDVARVCSSRWGKVAVSILSRRTHSTDLGVRVVHAAAAGTRQRLPRSRHVIDQHKTCAKLRIYVPIMNHSIPSSNQKVTRENYRHTFNTCACNAGFT